MPSREPIRRDESQASAASSWSCEALVEAAACAWSWDASTQRVEWTGATSRLCETVPSTLEGIDELLHEEDRAAHRALLSRALARGESWTCSLRLAGGPETRWIEERGRAWIDEERRPSRAVAVVLDVTARKRAEDSLEHELRRESRERHAAETATSLAEEALARLRDLQERREDVARMISHDLRTPLGVILAQAKLLGRRNEGANAVRARGDAIAASAQRMAAMLNDLVDSTLLGAGRLRLDLMPLDVVDMLRDLRGRLSAPFHGERIRVEAAADVPKAFVDSNRIERVLVNLLTNALKYSAAGSPVVARVRVEDAFLVIEVEDSGQGIAPEDLPHLFERYFRSLGSSRLEGMGLGLYTARMLVEAHGGTIAAASMQGKGSVFRVRLPLPPCT